MTEPEMHIHLLPHDWRRDLDLFMTERAPGMNAYMLSRHRLSSMARLHAMTDRQLAAMGLTRADIPAFVFEDLLTD
ncbi:DUF1127 domain-containing protein [Roseovarius sp. D22-M7]|uniref:DUF1127 domain-containing protein n=1 Tax=Roseovarius sp. D22-M7 TaxID=3127116 RepID=UPI00301036E5